MMEMEKEIKELEKIIETSQSTNLVVEAIKVLALIKIGDKFCEAIRDKQFV